MVILQKHAQILLKALLGRCSAIQDNDLQCSAIIFSPHQDDETLGCGGTIIKKKRAGAQINIVFLTDGRHSHSHLMPEDQLKHIRSCEAVNAGRMMGLDERDIIFLDYESRMLDSYIKIASEKVKEILISKEPELIYIPYHREDQPDHKLTNRIVYTALQGYPKKVVIYEYPIWFWSHWPWVANPIQRKKYSARYIVESALSIIYLLKDFRWAVDVSGLIDCKQAALEQYKSQMTRLMPDRKWMTLQDVSGGEFLQCFYDSNEIYHKVIWDGTT